MTHTKKDKTASCRDRSVRGGRPQAWKQLKRRENLVYTWNILYNWQITADLQPNFSSVDNMRVSHGCVLLLLLFCFLHRNVLFTQ